MRIQLFWPLDSARDGNNLLGFRLTVRDSFRSQIGRTRDPIKAWISHQQLNIVINVRQIQYLLHFILIKHEFYVTHKKGLIPLSKLEHSIPCFAYVPCANKHELHNFFVEFNACSCYILCKYTETH